MTPKGATMVIESMSLRIFEIQDIRTRLTAEEEHLKTRIAELEKVRDMPEGIQPTRIIEVK
jgi:hypothetical protein